MIRRIIYEDALARILELCKGETNSVALMATIVCEIHNSDDRFDWTGFYRVTEPRVLKIGPYQGGHGCLRIPFNRGICGQVASTGKPRLVNDVSSVQNHIACSPTTKSELVVPVFNGVKSLIAVLDIDSDLPAAFNDDDTNGLSKIINSIFSKDIM